MMATCNGKNCVLVQNLVETNLWGLNGEEYQVAGRESISRLNQVVQLIKMFKPK
jgi:hypothetical protein